MNSKITRTIITVIVAIAVYYGYSLFQDTPEEFSQKYVQGYMDINYANESNLYEETTGTNKEESKEYYKASIEAEMENFKIAFELDALTNEEETRLYELTDKMYQSSKYEVKLAKKDNESTYNVDVVISPINTIIILTNTLTKNIENASTEELEQIGSNWNSYILDLFEEQLNDIEYLEDVTVTVKVMKDNNELYSFDDQYMEELNKYIVSYEIN